MSLSHQDWLERSASRTQSDYEHTPDTDLDQPTLQNSDIVVVLTGNIDDTHSGDMCWLLWGPQAYILWNLETIRTKISFVSLQWKSRTVKLANEIWWPCIFNYFAHWLDAESFSSLTGFGSLCRKRRLTTPRAGQNIRRCFHIRTRRKWSNPLSVAWKWWIVR